MFDVIVVGAGLSGLQAAYSAKQAGLAVVVVEARNRVGGKVWSVPLSTGRGFADLGAAWVNDSKQPRIWSYVKQFGCKVKAQSLTGKAVMQLGENERLEYPFGITPDFSPEEKADLEKVRDHVHAESMKPGHPKPEDDQVSLDQYARNLGALPKTLKMVNVWSKAMHGLESTQESAAYFIDYCRRNTGLLSVRADDHTGGNYLRFLGGAGQIPNGIARLISVENIHLNSPVASISDAGSQVTVITTNGKKFTASKCIISVPSPMYKELNICPPLPKPLHEVVDSTYLGNYNKTIVVYDKHWWKDLGYNGFFMSYDGGPLTLGRDTSIPENRVYAMTLFVQGDRGEGWTKLYPHERRHAVLNQLAKIFNQGLESEVYKPIEVFDMIWKHEQYSRGALVPITQLGHLTNYASVYGHPTGNLHFVGTEYASVWKGYMEGALDSGASGAQQVFDALKKQNDGRARL